MYCIKCGVELADTEKTCPLCMTRVYHPDLQQPEGQPLYPADRYPAAGKFSRSLPIFLTAVFALALFFVVLGDLQMGGGLTWSGYVVGALITAYVPLVLPGWFRKANPVIFVPCSFAAATLYLWYINFAVDGDWFLSFAFPVSGGVGLLVTALVTLIKYVPKGNLFSIGGFCVALGGFMLLVEFLLHITFSVRTIDGWSAYPLAALAILGGFLIFLGISRSAREMMARKFFF